MISYVEVFDIEDFDDLKNMCWSGAVQRLEEIEKLHLEDEFYDYVDEVMREYAIEDVVTLTTINDFIWFDCDEWIEEHKKESEF